jgi:hypothetical protein
MYAQIVIRSVVFFAGMAAFGYASGWLFGKTFDKGFDLSQTRQKFKAQAANDDNVVNLK